MAYVVDLATGVHLPLGTAFIVAGATKLVATHPPWAGHRCVWASVLCVGVADLLNAPVAYRWAQDSMGVGWPLVISHLALIATTAFTFDVIHTVFRRSAAVRLRNFAVALAVALLALAPWVLSPPTTSPQAVAPLSTYFDSNWQSSLHWGVTMGYLIWRLGALRGIAVQRERAETLSIARTAMLIMNWAYLVAMAGFAINLAVQAAWLFEYGPRWTRAGFVASTTLAALAVVGLALGIAWSSAHEAWTRTAWRVPFSAASRDFCSIHRYWSALVAQLPEISYFPSDVTGRPRSHEELVWQRNRMVVEIHDLQRRLAPYVGQDDEQVIDHAVQRYWPTAVQSAAAEGVRLRLALRRLHDGASHLERSAPLPGTTSLAQAAAAIAATSRATRGKTHQAALDRIFDKELA